MNSDKHVRQESTSTHGMPKNPGAWMSAVIGVNKQTRQVFARKVYTCGYCAKTYTGARCRCPQCKSRKVKA
jgi:hypothetical protein